MFAVVQTGGKQYKVSEGMVLQVEKLEQPVGETVTLDKVLMIGEGEKTDIGHPFLEAANVSAEVTGQLKAKKIIVFKKKRRKKYRRKNGHRQLLTEVKITAINRK